MPKRIWILRLLALAVVAAQSAAQGQPSATIPQDSVWAPPTATIDPSDFYSEPFTPEEPSLMPQGDPFLYPNEGMYDPALQSAPFYQRFQRVSVQAQHTYLAPMDSRELGLNETEASVTLAFPNRPGVAPLLVTPGLAVQWWEGPETFPELPGQTYSAWLDFAWNPQVTPWFGASLAVRPGIYSDFEHVSSDSFRIKASGLAVFTLSPRWQIAAGAMYLDRNEVKVLPAGGFVWTPNDDVRWELIFPQPKLAQRLVTYGNTHLWWYVGGEYGGDSWTVESQVLFPGVRDQVDYNDIRVYAGLEFKPAEGCPGLGGHIEVGYVFDRELVYRRFGEFDFSDTIMVRGGIRY
jgi:hypothetical protein